MKFPEIIEALNQGEMCYRGGWNGMNMFVFRQVPSIIPASVVPNMTSLPQKVKDEFIRRFNSVAYQVNELHYTNQYCIVNSSNLINSWVPSVSDINSDDWQIYKGI